MKLQTGSIRNASNRPLCIRTREINNNGFELKSSRAQQLDRQELHEHNKETKSLTYLTHTVEILEEENAKRRLDLKALLNTSYFFYTKSRLDFDQDGVS